MSVILTSDGHGIGSAYLNAENTFTWSFVIRLNGLLEYRQGYGRSLEVAGQELLAAATKAGVSNPLIVTFK